MECKQYVGLLQEALTRFDWSKVDELAALITQAAREDKQIFVFGNGGSGATATHLVEDLAKGALYECGKRLRILALTDNTPLILAWANDVGYEDIFVGQLKNFLDPGDLVIGISGSGNSPNVLKALEYAKQAGATTVGLTGFEGGKLKQLVDLALIVPSDNMQRIEDVHLVIAHLLYVKFVAAHGLPDGAQA